MIEIKSVDGRVIYTSNKETIRGAVEDAVANGVSLDGADLSSANLRSANLEGADMRGANLEGADLSSANLRNADFDGANLGGANLEGAYLWGADLSGADLSGANLWCANLGGANLSGAYLRGANLGGANLGGAYLRGANLSGVKNADYALAVTSICPEGDIIGYKNTNQGVVKLRIPEHAARSNATGRRCRASEAVVLETPNHEPATSQHDPSFVYREGETVRPIEPFDPDRWNECSAGIHFFLTRIEAEMY